MAYSELPDLLIQISEKDLVGLTDDANTGTINKDTVTATTVKADAIIDSFMAAKYSVPLSPVPTITTHHSVIITLQLLYARRSGSPEHIQTLYDNTMMFLQAIGEGTLTLGDNDPDGDRTDDVTPVFVLTNRLLTRAKMNGF